MTISDILLQTAPAGQQGGGMSMIIMLVLMFVVFYFFMIRPQQKKQKEINKFREELRPGSKVMTAGGIHGVVVSIQENTFVISIATDVNIIVEKSCILQNSEDVAEANGSKK